MLTLVAVLAGTVLGGVIALVGEVFRSSLARNRELEATRRRAFATFMASASVWANTIANYYEARSESDAVAVNLWRDVLRTHDKCLAPLFEVRLLCSKKFLEVVDVFREHIIDYEKKARTERPGQRALTSEWEAIWDAQRDTVTQAAKIELGLDWPTASRHGRFPPRRRRHVAPPG
jgi:hypothetical protein